MPPPFPFHLHPGDDVPLYRQLVRQVVEGVASGALPPGERLPSLRTLASKLVVAPLTVKKAYDVLEAQGLIETRRGQGTFVRLDAALSRRSARERLRSIVRRLVGEAHLAGVEGQALLDLVEEEERVLRAEREGHQTREEAS